VWGLSRAGKTQLVLEYVQHYWTDYKAVFWIEAGQKESLERDFVNPYQTLYGAHGIAGQDAVSIDMSVPPLLSGFDPFVSSERGLCGRFRPTSDGDYTYSSSSADASVVGFVEPSVLGHFVFATRMRLPVYSFQFGHVAVLRRRSSRASSSKPSLKPEGLSSTCRVGDLSPTTRDAG
jgi:hypothetical protein